ncbi:hypothetical protein D3C80_1977040 [compost metagenome]
MVMAAHTDQPAMVPSAAISSSTEAISNLSAIGSSIRPMFDVWFQIRARYPSRKSVIEATIKIHSAVQRAKSELASCPSTKKHSTMTGTARIRA